VKKEEADGSPAGTVGKRKRASALAKDPVQERTSKISTTNEEAGDLQSRREIRREGPSCSEGGERRDTGVRTLDDAGLPEHTASKNPSRDVGDGEGARRDCVCPGRKVEASSQLVKDDASRGKACRQKKGPAQTLLRKNVRPRRGERRHASAQIAAHVLQNSAVTGFARASTTNPTYLAIKKEKGLVPIYGKAARKKTSRSSAKKKKESSSTRKRMIEGKITCQE